MTALEEFKKSNAWHQTYNLPLSPQNNNPWVYLAWARRIIELSDKVDPMVYDDDFRYTVYAYLQACEREPGLFHRWPNGDGGVTSHDELIGICSLDKEAACRVHAYLVAHDGYYNNTGEKEPVDGWWDLSKFFWFMSYVKSRAFIKLGLVSQLWWVLHVLFSAIKTQPDTDNAGGLLLIWLMAPEMDKWPLCQLANMFWRWRLKRMGVTPQEMLALEPKENPIYAQLGPEEF